MLVEQPFDLAHLLRSSRRLSHIDRYAGTAVQHRENVAEHSFYVAYYALALGRLVNTDGLLDMGRLLEAAVLHHVDKGGTGDVLRRIKQADAGIQAGLDRLATEYMGTLSAAVGVLLDRSRYVLEMHPKEARILYIADLLGVVSYLVEETSSGNRHLRNKIQEVRQLFSELSQTTEGPLANVVFQALMLLDGLVTEK